MTYKSSVFPGCRFLSSCHHLVDRRWLAVRSCHYIFMCLDNRPLWSTVDLNYQSTSKQQEQRFHFILYYFRLWYGNLLYLSFQIVSCLQDLLLVLSYVRRAAYTRLTIWTNTSYSLFKGSLSLSTRGYRFPKCKVLYHLLSPLLIFIRHLWITSKHLLLITLLLKREKITVHSSVFYFCFKLKIHKK